MGNITLLLARAREGDKASLDAIFELLHPELRQIAHRRLAGHQREGGVDTTALVHECYLKLVPRDAMAPAGRAHFLGCAATVMRSIIVDAARAAKTERRGGDVQQVTWTRPCWPRFPTRPTRSSWCTAGPLRRILPAIRLPIGLRTSRPAADTSVRSAVAHWAPSPRFPRHQEKPR